MKKEETTKAIIFDSSTLINFAMNGLLTEFRELKNIFNGKFLVTKEVQTEVIEKPMSIKRFELEALKIKELLKDKILESPSVFGISDDKISKKSREIEETANTTFFGKENAISIIHSGESSCLALSSLLNENGIINVVSVDERTIRLLVEKPDNLLEIFQKKLHTNIKAKREKFKSFSGFKFIRSSELIYIAYKKGIVKLRDNNILDALLYALKFNGCSVSDEEIEEMKEM